MQKSKRNKIIIAGLAFLIVFAIFVVHSAIKQGEESSRRAALEASNPGGTGGDYIEHGSVGLMGRGYLARVIGQKNTDLFEDYLKAELPKLLGDKKEYLVIISENGVGPSDPPVKWHYIVDILVDNNHEYAVDIDIDPDAADGKNRPIFSIKSQNKQ